AIRTALLNPPYPTRYLRHPTSLLLTTGLPTAKADRQRPLPMSRLSESINRTPTIQPIPNTRVVRTALLNRQRPTRPPRSLVSALAPTSLLNHGSPMHSR